jgi:fructoselysine-6-P-deglycase FrlB-like protein
MTQGRIFNDIKCFSCLLFRHGRINLVEVEVCVIVVAGKDNTRIFTDNAFETVMPKGSSK